MSLWLVSWALLCKVSSVNKVLIAGRVKLSCVLAKVDTIEVQVAMGKGYCLWKSYDYAGNGLELLDLFVEEPFLFFLDSSLKTTERGRYSFIGFDPFQISSTKDKNCLEELREGFQQYAVADTPSPSPFWAGLAGYWGYDFGLHLERIKRQAVDDAGIPDCLFGFYDCLLTIDHWQQKLYITSTGLPEKQPFLVQKRAAERMNRIVKRLSGVQSSVQNLAPDSLEESNGEAPQMEIPLVSNFTQENYLKAIDKALNYIRQGDIYQVNLSQRFSCDFALERISGDSVALYQSLRGLSPSHFGVYFNAGDFQILSSSPERFLRKEGHLIQTRPMKGTRPRGQSLADDRRLKEELWHSQKEIAELLMVTDLERSDLGRVCEYGSVKVKQLRCLEEYATVFQTTATIEGILRKEKDCFDVIAACFPSGSVTGCPKIRAMEIIEELEPVRRAIYTGSFGYIGFNGEMDFNVLIRSLLIQKSKVYFHVGGGIVADSMAEQEYQETLVKAGALMRSLRDFRAKVE